MTPVNISMVCNHCKNLLEETYMYMYRIYSCISRPFIAKNQPKKIALDLYTSHTQIPDQAVQEISITIA